MTTKYIAYCEEKGVYLGSCMGLGFWSNLDSVGQSEATLFENNYDAIDHFSNAEIEIGYTLIPVEVFPQDNYIHTDELRRQGRPYWSVAGGNE